MCTVAVFYRQLRDWPIVVAQNRDALADRAANPPSVLNEAPLVFGPQDITSSGTWIGVNASGLLLALTNGYQADRDRYAADLSRGLLVLNVLKEAEETEGALELASHICATNRMKHFHLFVADRRSLFKMEYDGRMRVEELAAGRHFHYSSGYDDGTVRRRRVRRLGNLLADRALGSLEECLTELKAACGDHFENNVPSQTSICMHGTDRRTTSSTIIALPETTNRRDVVCEYLSGYPCENEYRRFSIPRDSGL